MRQASKRIPDSAEKTVRDIRRNTRRHHSAEEKIRIVLEGLRGEVSIAELCPKEGINQNLYYRWSKEFLEAGKKRLAGDTAREATSDEVKELKAEARQLKETLAEVLIENRLLKKSVLGDGENASGSNPSNGPLTTPASIGCSARVGDFVFCFNASDGKFTAHEAMVSQDVRTLRDFAGNPFGEQIYRNAKEGQIMEVAYVWPMPGSTRYVLKSAYVARAGDQVCGVSVYR